MRIIVVILVCILVIGIIAVASVFALLWFQDIKIPEKYNIETTTINKTAIGIEQINLMLYNINAHELHNPPMSDNTPKIEISIDNETYNVEIIKNEFNTKKGVIDNEDIRIFIPKQEIIAALNSLSLKIYLKNSFEQGNSKLELVAGKTELFSKGYLALYTEITGKSLTGSIIRFFDS